MQQILMVCLGNICRSPLAEGILQSKVDPSKISVDSAGTAAYHVGELPDKRSIATAKKYGIDLTQQRARKFSIKDFDIFDIIYAMDQSNYQDLLSLARNQQDKDKLHLILNESYPNEQREVPDPYYGGVDGFEQVYQLLDEACTVIQKKIE
ncbi:protein-tyrosine-phosphatase [Polaribacter pacificus]|uniref:protein-tyrosine-phosphatase n=1 Tax=Polaribacter pacificus TaxID=1775173 RepID=A0A917I072_9FLAO|nr:low molecular weight protein-tyrosine-phosphatase [Polaribacter pacificus]GGH00385.1 protein-tyrosine-phosphatase [Polaribacter pacificus]